MKPVRELLSIDGFLKALFESIPCGVLVIDRERRIQAVNDVASQTFGLTPELIIDKRAGEALNCIYSTESSQGCGFGSHCKNCSVRNTAVEALEGNTVRRNKARFQLLANGTFQEMVLLVSAAPVVHESEDLAIILLEDITELNSLRKYLNQRHSLSGLVGSHHKMQELYNTILEVAQVNVPILIQGESGTGKELVASAIHEHGPRANGPFVPVNCAALPEGLLESELFGHVKGAFTGAVRNKRGRFELAHGGTILLDEVGDLPRPLQGKLLRVLQQGSFEPVGAEKSISVDVRVISATNHNLKKKINKGEFREDLYYRLNVVLIELPPLRDRKDDIPLLADYFISNAPKEGLETAEISMEALSLIKTYSWPGNVRELQNAIRYALVKAKGEEIKPTHLPMEVRGWNRNRSAPGPSKKLDPESVKFALKESGGNKAKAARSLGVGRATLYRFLEEFPDIE